MKTDQSIFMTIANIQSLCVCQYSGTLLTEPSRRGIMTWRVEKKSFIVNVIQHGVLVITMHSTLGSDVNDLIIGRCIDETDLAKRTLVSRISLGSA